MKTAVLMAGVPSAASLWLESTGEAGVVAYRNSLPKEKLQKFVELYSLLDAIDFVPHAKPTANGKLLWTCCILIFKLTLYCNRSKGAKTCQSLISVAPGNSIRARVSYRFAPAFIGRAIRWFSTRAW
jgi:hypothetical protein